MITKTLIVLLLASTGGAGVLYWQNGRLSDRLAVSGVLLDGCTARNKNLLEDKNSDDKIDQIPDTDLRFVPDGWMLPAGSSGQ